MMKSLRGAVCMLLVMGWVSVAAADDVLAGTWTLNWPASTGTTWEFEQSGEEIFGTSTIQAGRFVTNCAMQGDILLPGFSQEIFLADVLCVRTPGNITTTAITVFQVQGDEIRGVLIEMLEGIPISFVELSGTRVVEGP